MTFVLRLLQVLIFASVIGAFVTPIPKSRYLTAGSSSQRDKSPTTNNVSPFGQAQSPLLKSWGNVRSAAAGTSTKATEKDDDIKSQILAAEATDEEEKQKRLRSSYGVLAVLLITFASNQWSRQALYYLCDFSASSDPFKHINAGLNFDKEMYAALASFGFTLVFATVSLFAGGVSDKYDRNKVTAISCAVWSTATALQAAASSFRDLIPLRAIIGASQAFYNPAAYTLIAELFPKKMIGGINGIFSSGIYLGGALASLSIILDGMVGWRQTLLVIGGVGLLSALACLVFVIEPRSMYLSSTTVASREREAALSNKQQQKQSSSAGTMTSTSSSSSSSASSSTAEGPNFSVAFQDSVEALKDVIRPTDAKLLFLASALRFCAGFSIAIWKAPFVFAKFPGSEAAFAGSNAAVVAFGGLFSSLIGGFLSDRLSSPPDSTTKPRARSWVPAVGSLLAAPLWAAFVLADDPAISALCLFGEYLAAECWFGPTLASLFNVVPRERRGTAQGLFSVLTAAGNIAPVAVGALAGGQLGNFPLGDVLIWAVSGSYVLSGILFLLVAIGDDKRITLQWEEQQKLESKKKTV